MSSPFDPRNSAIPTRGITAVCLRRVTATAVWGGLILALGLGGIGVEVTWAQSADVPGPETAAARSNPGTANPGTDAAVPQAHKEPVLEAERTDTIDAERPAAPPDVRPAEPASTPVPKGASPVLQPSRERVILEPDPRTPGQRSTPSLSAQTTVQVAPAWARAESGVSFADGTLVLRSRRFSSPEEACQELTNLVVTWLRQKYESETGGAIADPVGVLRQSTDLELVLQSYVQDIALNDQKVLETPMFIGHLRLPVTEALRERVYADWRAQLVNQRLIELVGGAALLSGMFVVMGRFLRNFPESQ